MKAIYAAAIVALTLAACGDSGTEKSETEKAPEPVAEEAAKTETPAAEAPVAEEEVTEEEVTEEQPAEAPAAEEEAAEAPEPMDEPAAEAEAAARTPSPAGAKVFFVSPKDGDVIKGPIPLIFGVEGMEAVPAGTDQPNSGHHHLIIDGKVDDYNSALPADANHRHFGGGQTEAAIGLPAGKHTLQLIFADMNHVPHDPPVESEVITITVEE